MSELKVEVVAIDEVQPHPNADRLELAQIKGWQCVVSKDSFKRGDKVVYIPIDSILPPELEDRIFPPESKVRLSKSRVRTIKLRGAISQGLVISPKLALGDEKPIDQKRYLALNTFGSDVTKMLGITKYEPKQREIPSLMRSGKGTAKQNNPNFYKYTDINNYKNYNELFKPGEEVTVTEKVHGTNFRAGWVRSYAYTPWQKLKKWLGYLPEWEFVYGSHNVQRQNRGTSRKYSDSSVYGEIVKKYGLKNKLHKGEVIYGEIYGSGIQSGYTYGCENGEHRLVVFDIKMHDIWQDFSVLVANCPRLGLATPPVLYKGPYDFEKIKALTVGHSVLSLKQKVIEGVVIKSSLEQSCYAGRKVLKLISDDYLLGKNNTDFH